MPRSGDDWSYEETRDPLCADDRNFYEVEKWTRDGTKVDSLLYRQQSRQGAGYLCSRDQASPTDQIGHPPAHPRDATALDLKSIKRRTTEVRLSREEEVRQ